VGDSRATIVSFDDEKKGNLHDNILVVGAKPISRDHKPEDPEEGKKILDAGGRIDTFKDSNGGCVGPQRVWLKNEDIPGLAMTRSFGDAVSLLAGVTAEPEIKEYELKKEDKMIVIASDGVWEFMSNEHVRNYLKI
jgi:serine/threonine protein phosphatase PrpC